MEYIVLITVVNVGMMNKNITTEKESHSILLLCSNKKCKWKGQEDECSIKRFGDYLGDKNEFPELWGWEEWDNFTCPKCGEEIKN